MASVELGIDTLLAIRPNWLRKARIGLLANQASVDSRLQHTRDRLLEAGVNLTAIFAPQHGYFAEQQANMIESDDFVEFTALINIRPSQGNKSMEVLDISIKQRMDQIIKKLMIR